MKQVKNLIKDHMINNLHLRIKIRLNEGRSITDGFMMARTRSILVNEYNRLVRNNGLRLKKDDIIYVIARTGRKGY